MFNIAFLSIIAYLLGSINTSILVSKLIGKTDIRKHGSGNAGATNTLRILGKKAAILVVLGDALKGVVAIIIARIMLKLTSDTSVIPLYGAALFVTLGHNFPAFFGFKGGKGVLTSAVVILMLDPIIGIIVLTVALSTMAISKYVSLGSCLGAVVFVVLSFIFKRSDIYFIILSFMLAALILIRHKDNIKRLAKGTESKLGAKKEEKNG